MEKYIFLGLFRLLLLNSFKIYLAHFFPVYPICFCGSTPTWPKKLFRWWASCPKEIKAEHLQILVLTFEG